MKEILVNTAIGRFFLFARDKLQILYSANSSIESVGTLANDQLATKLVTSLCKSNKVFVDVGAHIGSIISAVASRDLSISIIAIEAIPDKIANLKHIFPAVEFHGCAVGDHDGEISFFVNKTRSGYSSLARPSKYDLSEIVEIKVPIKKLDHIISSNKIDIIKIDVEGAEMGVLIGGESIIESNRPIIMFESAPPRQDGLNYTKEAMWHWLHNHTYDILIPNRVAHNGPGLDLNGFIDSHLYPRRTTNYFAIPHERREEVRASARDRLGYPIA